MNIVETKIQLAPGARMPEYATPGASCMDCFANLIKLLFVRNNPYTGLTTTKAIELHDNESLASFIGEVDMIIIDPGFALELPEDYAVKALANSRFAKAGWRLANGIGVIDNDYRGHIKFIYEPSPSTRSSPSAESAARLNHASVSTCSSTASPSSPPPSAVMAASAAQNRKETPMPDKFLKRNGAIYMRVAEMHEGKLDMTALAGLSLAMEDMQRLLEVALQPEPAAQGETAQLLTRKQLAAHLGTSYAHIMAMEKIGDQQ